MLPSSVANGVNIPQLCYVYFKPIRKEMSDFVTHVPIRMQRLLREEVVIHVMYCGHINEQKLRNAGIICHQFRANSTESPLMVAIKAGLFARQIGQLEGIDFFINVWAHYLLLPVSLAARSIGAKSIARISGIPLRGRGKGTIPGNLRSSSGRLFEHLSLRSANTIHALAEYLVSIYTARGLKRNRFVVISNGCDTSRFSPLKDPNDISDPTYTNRLLYVGRLDENKNVGGILNAFAALNRECSSRLELVVAGTGPQENALHGLCRTLGLADQVSFLGHVEHDQLPGLYRTADLFILASRSEGMPNAVLEAQASAVPVVATSVGAIPDLLSNNRGLLVEPDNHEDLVAKLKTAIENPDLREAFATNALRYVRNQHSLEAVRSQYLNLFLRSK